MIRRVAVVLALLTTVSVTAGAASVLPIGESAPLQVIETDDVPDLSTTSTTSAPPEIDAGSDDKVLVCVVLVHHDTWTLKPGKNPIEVAAASANARDADAADHPSYAAERGDETCVLPAR